MSCIQVCGIFQTYSREENTKDLHDPSLKGRKRTRANPSLCIDVDRPWLARVIRIEWETWVGVALVSENKFAVDLRSEL